MNPVIRRYLSVIFGLLMVIGLVAGGLAIFGENTQQGVGPNAGDRCFEPSRAYQGKTVAVRTACRLNLEVADTESKRTLGLSHREKLPATSGLLFVFETSGQHCIWMKDMNFSIDIIWLDEAKRIVKIQSEVSPDTYPENFCNDGQAKYVIETNARVASSLGLRVGQQVAF